MNNIETLNPEGWFNKLRGMKRLNNNDDGICISYHYKGTFLWATTPAVAELMLRQSVEAMYTQPKNLACFNLS